MKIFVLFLLCALSSNLIAVEKDEQSGLLIAPGWRLVMANCVGCHSLNLVTSQRLNKESWHDTIRWMQKTQNLWELDEEIENKIISYLAEYYKPDKPQRRAILPDHLLPEKLLTADN